MVEGHQCHRLAILHRAKLVGKAFKATSPNGRFSDGARIISDRTLRKIEVIGKNLFYFFDAPKSQADDNETVVHIHFGMSGRFTFVDEADAPPPKETTRLELRGHGLVGQLSAMTVQHGGLDLFESKRRALGQDPVRDDAVADLAWDKVKGSKKSIGSLVMDQSVVAGVGNIYRAELLFKAGIHPDVPGHTLTKAQFMDGVWHHAKDLLHRGVVSGSIVTVDEAEGLGPPWTRRYIYNQRSCGRCGDHIVSWSIENRTAYACPTCQPPASTSNSGKAPAVIFPSHCARDDLSTMLCTPEKLTVKQLREALGGQGVTVKKSAKKAELVSALKFKLETDTPAVKEEPKRPTAPRPAAKRHLDLSDIASPAAAADEKRLAGEKRSVEHVPVETDF